MTRNHWVVFVALPGILGAGCGPATTATAAGGASGSGTGDSSASGGTSGTGGIAGSGGSNATGTGGVTIIGGNTGTGGTTRSGGTAGTDGATSSGGATGTGGTTATGGGGPGAGGSAGRAGTGGTMTGAGGTQGSIDGGRTTGTASAGCGKAPTLKNSPASTVNQNTLTISGTSRQFLARWPNNYDNSRPYRLILDFHGAGGKDTDLAPTYFGLFDLSNNSTVFVAPSANGGIWDATADSTFADEVLKTVEGDLCIDTSRFGEVQSAALIVAAARIRDGANR